MKTQINKFQRTYKIIDESGAYILGYIYDGEVFSISVPEVFRRMGIAKKLLLEAEKIVDTEKLCFTSAISKEGGELIKWYNSQEKK